MTTAPESVHRELAACPQCDALQRVLYTPTGRGATCYRCESDLWKPRTFTPEVSLALTIAAAILFLVANAFPLIEFNFGGSVSATTLIGATIALWHEDMELIGSLVFVTTVIVPTLELSAMLYLLIGSRVWETEVWHAPPPHTALVLRLLQAAQPWAMLEVFLLGSLVSYVKLAAQAQVHAGISLWALALVITIFIALTSTFDVDDFWRRLPVRRLDA